MATCRIGDLLSVPEAGLIFTIPGPDQGPDTMLAGAAYYRSFAPHVMKIFVGHTGKSQLQWKARVGGGSPWLTVSNTTGQSGDTIQVVANPKGLDYGTYRDSIIVDNTSASGSAVVPVRFDIDSCAVTAMNDAGGEKTGTLNSADCGAPHDSVTQAEIFSFNGTQNNVATVLLSAGFNGFVAVGTSLAPAVPPLDTASQCLGDTKNPCIYYYSLPTSATYYVEVSGATAADTGAFKVRLITGAGRPPNSVQSLEQRQLPDSSQIVAIGGSVGASVLVHGLVSDSDLVDSIRLQAEWEPIGTDFQGIIMSTSPTYTHNGQIASVVLSGLQDNVNYHWQVRAVDQRGNFSSQGTHWDSLPRGSSPDFTVQIGHDPNAPANLVQLQSDGTTQIPTGGYATTSTVKFRGVVSDPDVGDVLHLEVEAEPVGTDTTGTASPNQTFTTASSGNTSVATLIPPTIQDRTSYHWIARAVDQGGRHSPWVAFGGNAENQVDFRDSVANAFNLVFTTQPPAQVTAGSAMTVVVTAQNALGQTITTFTSNVTMSASGPGTLSGTTSATAQAGVATFNNLILTKTGGYTLLASSGVTNSQPSNSITVNPATAAQLAFTTQPSNAVSGQSMVPPVQVTVQDAYGNTVPSYATQVSLAIRTNPNGGTLTGGGAVTPLAGIATWNGVSIDKAGGGYQLGATSGSLPASPASNTFTISPGPVTKLAFIIQPSNAQASPATITPPVQVAGQDFNGNTVPSFTGNVTVAINPPPSGTLGGTLTRPASNGIAIFSDLSIVQIGNGYSLAASSGSLTGAISNPFNITNNQISASLSTAVANPTTITASTGSSVSTITVTARDISGNLVQGASVNLSVSGTGNSVTQPAPTNASGVTTGTISSTKAETKTVTVTISSVVINAQPTIQVNPAAPASLSIATPNNTVAGAAINAASGGVVVTASDQFGNLATSFSSTVTMSLVAGPGPFAPTSNNSAPASGGVATFPGLRIYQAGTGYQLQAAGGGLTSPASSAFNVTVGAINKVGFVVQPSTTADSAAIAPPVTVAGQDSVGNTVTSFSGLVRMFIGQPGGGGTLSGTTQVNAVGGTGIATFSNLRINKMGTGYTLLATSTGIASDESNPFDIIAGPAAKLIFSTQPPAQTVAGVAMSGPIQVTAQDNQGNTATSFGGAITLSIGTNPLPGTGVLSGGGPVNATNGVASFPSASIDKANSGYTLLASASGVTGATSASFNIVSGGVSPSLSTIARSPTSIAASTGAVTSTITVTAKDNLGNPIQGATVVIGATGTGNTLTQPTLATDVNGQATGTISSTKAESKTISATINATPINATTTVVVNPAAAKQLLFVLQPTNTAATQFIRPGGFTVEIRDTFLNPVTTATNPVTISILNNPAGGTLSGTLTATTGNAHLSGGVATFNDNSIDKVGTGYTLLAASAGLVSDTSSAFNITAGVATQLAFGQQPTSTTGGATIAPPVTVRILDAGGNQTTSGATVTLAITGGTGTAGAHLSNGASVQVGAVNGTATFNTLNVDSVGTGYTLTATSGSLTAATSSSFNITVGAAAKLAFGQQPTTQSSATAIAPAVTVRVLDAGGNLTTSGATVAVAISAGTGTSGAHLLGTVSVGAGSGTATFNTLNIDSAGTGYTLRATSGSLTAATSNGFNITVGSATKLGFRIQPANTTGGATLSSVQVEIRDAGGNRVTSGSRNISLTLSSNPNNGTLSGTTSNVASSAGLANFSDLSIDSAATGYVLQATASGGPPLTGATSSSFNITVGAAARLIFLTQPDNAQTSGATVTPVIQVEVADLGGNRVTSSTATIAIDFGTNPDGNPLGGTLSKQAGAGVVSFDDLVITGSNSGYTLVATSSGLTGTGPSNSFSVN